MKLRQKLIDKIKIDTGIIISKKDLFFRPTLSWQHKTAGRFIWYFLIQGGELEGKNVGSCENMIELLKSEKILCDFGEHHWGFYGLSSS